MRVTRKEFLTALAAASAAALAPVRAFAGTASGTPGTMAARYQAAVNTSFWVRLQGTGGRAELVLLEVTPREFKGPNEQFSLHFLAPRSSLVDGTYFVEHAELGESMVFVTRLNEDARGVHYRADFNLLADSEKKP
jgi:hypothetical protein